MYFLHLHKCGGSFLCGAAAKVYGAAAVNGADNCNVPTELWQVKDAEGGGRQREAYMGNTPEHIFSTYTTLLQRGYAFVANEGALEDEPLTCLPSGGDGPKPYLYVRLSHSWGIVPRHALCHTIT